MIQTDATGAKFVITVTGERVDLPAQVAINLNITTTLPTPQGIQIVPIQDAIAVHQALSAHWFQKVVEQQELIANLREQLTAHGIDFNA
jgi:hypothetical protein